MSDFVNTPLEKLFNRRNIVSRLERLERRTLVPKMNRMTQFSKIADDASLINTSWQVLYAAEAVDGSILSGGPGGVDSALVFGNIPDTGKQIEISLLGRSATAAASDGVSLVLNDDVGNTYIGAYQYGGPSPDWAQQTTAGAPTQCAQITGNTSTANWVSNAIINIFYYASSTYKSWQTSLNVLVTASGNNVWMYNAGGLWLSTAPITTVSLAPVSGDGFAAISRATIKVYG